MLAKRSSLTKQTFKQRKIETFEQETFSQHEKVRSFAQRETRRYLKAEENFRQLNQARVRATLANNNRQFSKNLLLQKVHDFRDKKGQSNEKKPNFFEFQPIIEAETRASQFVICCLKRTLKY